MGVKDFSRSSPVLDFFLAQLFLAFLTKVFDHRRLWVALAAEVIEENCDFEVLGQDASFILADVLR